MGADEKVSDAVRGLIEALAPTVTQRLDDGWKVIVGAEDQLQLVPPDHLSTPDTGA